MNHTPSLLELAERKIIATGEHLAAQIGGTFTINPRKLSDFRARLRASNTNKEQEQ
jgi:hypothetical protein